MFELRVLRSWTAPLALAGMGAVGFALGTLGGSPNDAAAQTPAGPVVQATATTQPTDYSQRVVAYIHGNVPITREDLGEFLIARHGYNNLEMLVNRRIIDHECAAKKITVTDAEVEASLEEDLKPMNIDRATFVKHVLKQRNKTLYEWKEDVIRPGLMLTKLCRADVKVEEAELKKLFEAKYGEKVCCRIIIWKENEGRAAMQAYDKIRKSEEEFATAARAQYIPALAATGGAIDPIGRGAAENDLIEKKAFSLHKDEMSEIFQIPGQGYAVMKCGVRVPPVEGVTFEKVKAQLQKEVFDAKVAKAIPAIFKKMQEEAKPNLLVPAGTVNPFVVRTKEEEDRLMKEDPKPLAPLPMPNPK